MILFSVDLKDQPGEFAHLCEAMAHRHVNLMIAGVTSVNHGAVCFSVSDEAEARTALEEAGIDFTARDALAVRCQDRPGEGAMFARKLADAEVNIQALLPISVDQNEVVLAVAVDKVDDAAAALADQLVR